jgi:hypothetical protein
MYGAICVICGYLWIRPRLSIRNRLPVTPKRPRARTDAELTAIQERILAMFQYDINQEADYSI